jgi:hypothetical protein
VKLIKFYLYVCLTSQVRSIQRYVLNRNESWSPSPEPKQANGDQMLDQEEEQGVDALFEDRCQSIR